MLYYCDRSLLKYEKLLCKFVKLRSLKLFTCIELINTIKELIRGQIILGKPERTSFGERFWRSSCNYWANDFFNRQIGQNWSSLCWIILQNHRKLLCSFCESRTLFYSNIFCFLFECYQKCLKSTFSGSCTRTVYPWSCYNVVYSCYWFHQNLYWQFHSFKTPNKKRQLSNQALFSIFFGRDVKILLNHQF